MLALTLRTDTPVALAPRRPARGPAYTSKPSATWVAGMSDEREVLTWSDFGAASRVLATEIATSGFRTDIVIAVARGGLLPAGRWRTRSAPRPRAR